MDQHAKMSLNIAQLYSKWAEQVCLFLSAPFDEHGPLAEQPTPEKKTELLRDAEAHRHMSALEAALLDTDAVDDPDKH